MVAVQALGPPIVQILTAPRGSINSMTQLQLTASVAFLTTGTAFWSVNDTQVNITTASLSNTFYELSGYNLVSLTLSANVLVPGSTLAFKLFATCKNHLSSHFTMY
jgi:hypothetical protein